MTITRTAQIAFAATAAWTAVLLCYAGLLLSDLSADSLGDWGQMFSDIPALAIFIILPVIAFGLSVVLSYRLYYGDETPRDRAFAIALLAPGLAWVALVAFEYLA